jgi:hypothetical protein
MVVETAHLNAEELSAYCRRQGLYPPPIEAWRSACLPASAPVSGQGERTQRRLVCAAIAKQGACYSNVSNTGVTSCPAQMAPAEIGRVLR